MPTRFAPPERLPKAEIEAVSRQLREEILLPWFDAVPAGVLVVDSHRQIVYANRAFLHTARKLQVDEVVGLRPGEALGCIHAEVEPAGCGCSEFCSVCGAAIATLSALRGEEDCQVCRMLRRLEDGEAPLDLEVHTRPVGFLGQRFALFTTLDISHEKRLRHQERVFFHDLVNLAGGMSELTQLLDLTAVDAETAELFAESARRILREVLYLRDVSAAEQGRLVASPETFEALPFFTAVAAESCEACRQDRSRVRIETDAQTLHADRRLLGHVLRNMLKNALEAMPGGEVLLACRLAGGRAAISVTNTGTIAPEIVKQLFKRYVSTKGPDRGLGTYVMKLLAERHLGGSVGFSTTPDATTFTLLL